MPVASAEMFSGSEIAAQPCQCNQCTRQVSEAQLLELELRFQELLSQKYQQRALHNARRVLKWLAFGQPRPKGCAMG